MDIFIKFDNADEVLKYYLFDEVNKRRICSLDILNEVFTKWAVGSAGVIQWFYA